MNYVFYDCETGGLDCNKHSLLTAYFGVYNEDLELIDELDLKLKPADNKIVADDAALKVTGINIQEHLRDPKTLTYEEGRVRLAKLLERNKIKRKRKHYRPSGHNITFDDGFIWNQLMPKEEWSKLVHHNTIDTLRILTPLQAVGILPSKLGSLTSLVKYFDIKMGKAHDAKGDIEMTVEVWKHMMKILRGKRGHTTTNISGSLLDIIER